jgi:orotate phosphoribosyltransferase
MDPRTRLARLLLEKSYVEGEITLSSGRKSDYYFDCKQTALLPEGAWLIGTLFMDLLKPMDITGVGGMTLGADPLVSAVTVISHMQEHPLPGFIVRKEAKGHGTGRYLEGMSNFATGARVAMLEDVVTTGGTLIKACQRVRDAGYKIAAVCTILDREEGGREALAKAGYELKALYTREQLLTLGK